MKRTTELHIDKDTIEKWILEKTSSIGNRENSIISYEIIDRPGSSQMDSDKTLDYIKITIVEDVEVP